MVWRRSRRTTGSRTRSRDQREELRIDFDDLAAAEPAFDEAELQAALDAEAEEAERQQHAGREESDSSAA